MSSIGKGFQVIDDFVFPDGKCLKFTQEAKGLAREISSNVYISVPEIDIDGKRPINPLQYKAIWDTGATASVITNKVAEDLSLIVTGIRKIFTVGGICEAIEHRLDLWLPNNTCISEMPVVRGYIPEEFGMLIGLDIMVMGDFAFTNYQGKSMFSFRMPSIGHIDFTDYEETKL